jgi:virulence factor
MKKRIGLIGLGDIAQKVYLPLLSTHELVEIAGVMSTSLGTVKKMQEKYRIPFGTTKVDNLLRQEVDAIFVHSPTETHYSIVKQCLMEGIDVYVDKPISYEWQESLELAQLAEKKGVLLAVGFNRRFAPMYREAKQWLRSVGGFDWGSVIKHRMHPQKYPFKQTIYDDLIHMLDLLLWFAEEPFEVSSHQLQINGEGRLLHASGTLSFNEATGIYSMVRRAGIDLEKIELHGKGRSVEVTDLETAVFFELGQMPKTRHFGSWDSVWLRRGFEGVVQHFLESIEDPQHCEIRADLVLPSHQLVEQISI